MGGTLAIRFAETRPDDLAGLMLVNPALLTQRLDAKLLPLLARLTASWAPIASDIKKPGVVELAYPKLPDPRDDAAPRAVGGHPRRPARVTAPVIVFHSAEDHVVEPINTQVLLDGVSSTDTTEVVLQDSYHVATLDNDAPAIFEWLGGLDPGADGRPAGAAGGEPGGGAT